MSLNGRRAISNQSAPRGGCSFGRKKKVYPIFIIYEAPLKIWFCFRDMLRERERERERALGTLRSCRELTRGSGLSVDLSVTMQLYTGVQTAAKNTPACAHGTGVRATWTPSGIVPPQVQQRRQQLPPSADKVRIALRALLYKTWGDHRMIRA